MAVAGHQLAGVGVHPVQVAFEVADHHQAVLDGGAGEAAAVELVLLPQEAAAALLGGAHQAFVVGHEQGAQVGADGLVAGQVLAPVGAAVFPVEHRQLALEGGGEDAAVFHQHVGVHVHQAVQFGAAGGFRHAAFPQGRAGVRFDGGHLAAGEAGVDPAVDDHRLGAAEQGQVGHRGFVVPELLAAAAVQAQHMAVDGLRHHQAAVAGGRGQHFTAHFGAPQLFAVFAVQGHHVAFAGAVEHLAVAGVEAAGDAVLGFAAPLAFAVFPVEGVDAAVDVGGEHLLVGHRRGQRHGGFVDAVTGAGAPQTVHVVAGLELRQWVGFDGVGVAAATGQRHQTEQKRGREGFQHRVHYRDFMSSSFICTRSLAAPLSSASSAPV